MSEFQDFFTNKKFIGSYNAVLSGNNEDKNNGIIYIEDASDGSFWEHFIGYCYPNQYICRPSSVNGKNVAGKRFLEKIYTEANEKAIVAVDSDYDYIASKKDVNHAFNHNKYIIHTYGFSRESVEIEKDRIQVFFKKCRLTIPNNVNLLDFINRFSELCFKGLTRYIVFLEANNFNSMHNKDFHSCFNVLKTKLVDRNLDLDFSVMVDIDRKIDLFFYDKNISAIDIDNMKIFLNNIGINEGNAYRFISGHVLYDLVKKIHRESLNQLMKSEAKNIRNNVNKGEIKSRVEQIRKKFISSFSIETHCSTMNIDHNDSLHEKIIFNIKNIKD